jgi:hypothetical protein
MTSKKMVFHPNDVRHELIYNMTEITGDEGKSLAWYYEIAKADEFASFPAHLSAFILGWSKVAMSRMRTALGIQTDPFHCPWYEDTDSIIVHNSAWERLAPEFKQTSKKELGRLKLEIENCKIIMIYVLAPKTYMVVYICGKTLAVKMKLRAKGIPRIGEDYLAFFKIPAENSEKMLKVLRYLYKNVKQSILLTSKIERIFLLIKKLESGRYWNVFLPIILFWLPKKEWNSWCYLDPCCVSLR